MTKLNGYKRRKERIKVQTTSIIKHTEMPKWRLFEAVVNIYRGFLLSYSGQPMTTNLRLEDGRIGEQPEVIYHVFHTLLFGGLALLFDGYAHRRKRVLKSLDF